MSTLFDHDLHFFHRNRRNLNEAKTHRKLVTEIIAPLSHRHRMFTARLERYIRRWFNNTSQVLSRKRDTIDRWFRESSREKSRDEYEAIFDAEPPGKKLIRSFDDRFDRVSFTRPVRASAATINSSGAHRLRAPLVELRAAPI